MSTKKSGLENAHDVMGKLDKVADTLESASSQLSGVVSQQQLDFVSQRVSSCENDITTAMEGMETLARRSAVHADESEVTSIVLLEKINLMHREFAGLRALTLSAFALSTISLIGLIILGVL